MMSNSSVSKSGRSDEERVNVGCFFFSSRRRHTRLQGDWSSDVCSSDLKGDVDAADEVPHRRLGQEVRRGEVVLTRLVELRIHALVVRPRREVATRDADAEGGGAELPGPLLGGEVGDGHLAQLGEAAVFDVAGLRALEVGDRRRLINERRRLVVQRAAVVARRQAAELLGAVEQFVAVAAVQQGIQPRSEEHTSELQSPCNLVCRLLLEKKKNRE